MKELRSSGDSMLEFDRSVVCERIRRNKVRRAFVRLHTVHLRFAFVACIAAMLAACAGCGPTQGDLLRDGQSLYDRGLYASALQRYNQVLEMNSKNVKAYEYRALTNLKMEQYNMAVNDLTEALRLDPQLVDAYIDRGRVFTEMDEYDAARSDFDMALSLDPKSMKAYNNRGTLFCKQGKYPQAIADYKRAIELAPRNVQTWYNLGLTYIDAQDYVNARATFEEALKRDKRNPAAYYYLGLSYARAQDYVNAEKQFTIAIMMMPNYAQALQARSLARYYLKNYDGAMGDAKQVEALGKTLNAEFMKELEQARDKAEGAGMKK